MSNIIIYEKKYNRINNPIKFNNPKKSNNPKKYTNMTYKILIPARIPLIRIEDFSLNIGIEIEVCTTRKSEKNINEKKKLKYFINTTDESIKCKDGYNAREYIIKGYIENKNLSTIYNNINNINKNSIECKDYSCGLHFHISSNNILLSIQGLIFLINFILNWNDKYQTEFEIKFYYKKYVKKSYSPPLILSETDIKLLKEKKKELINDLKKNKKINLLIFLKKIMYITRTKENNEIFNENSYNVYFSSRRAYLVVIEDTKFIHFEYRDLLPWALKSTIKDFPALVKEKYLETIEETNKEIEEINKNLY
jgi:hypothetical protein